MEQLQHLFSGTLRSSPVSFQETLQAEVQEQVQVPVQVPVPFKYSGEFEDNHSYYEDKFTLDQSSQDHLWHSNEQDSPDYDQDRFFTSPNLAEFEFVKRFGEANNQSGLYTFRALLLDIEQIFRTHMPKMAKRGVLLLACHVMSSTAYDFKQKTRSLMITLNLNYLQITRDSDKYSECITRVEYGMSEETYGSISKSSKSKESKLYPENIFEIYSRVYATNTVKRIHDKKYDVCDIKQQTSTKTTQKEKTRTKTKNNVAKNSFALLQEEDESDDDTNEHECVFEQKGVSVRRRIP